MKQNDRFDSNIGMKRKNGQNFLGKDYESYRCKQNETKDENQAKLMIMVMVFYPSEALHYI